MILILSGASPQTHWESLQLDHWLYLRAYFLEMGKEKDGKKWVPLADRGVAFEERQVTLA